MTDMLYPLATPSDYAKLDDGTFSLPQSDNYLSLDGSVCDDPHVGALCYNRGLIRYLKQHKNSDIGSLRYQHLFKRYATNHRIKKVREVALSIRSQQHTKAIDSVSAQPTALSSFSIIESALFFHVPVDTL